MEELFLKHLLMEPCPVEARGHGKLNVPLKCLIGRTGPIGFRIESLIKHQSLIQLFSIDESYSVLYFLRPA